MESFPRGNRLSKSSEYKSVLQKGKISNQNGLKVVFLPGDGKRMGLVVGAGIGKSVERSRIKRVFREFFRRHKEVFRDGDYVIVAKIGLASKRNEEIRELLEKALKKL